MRLKFEPFDGRGHHYKDVIDEDTGQLVGYVKSNGVGMYCSGGIEISLFDDKYFTIVNTYERCLGFVEGVEAVLKHLVFIKDRQLTKSEAA